MKKTMLVAAVAAVSLAFCHRAFAGTVNPTSNVLGDTAATANTLVLRDGSGNMAIVAADLSASAVVTAKLAANSVITNKLYLDQPTSAVACILTNKQLGTCTGVVGLTGLCSCQ